MRVQIGTRTAVLVVALAILVLGIAPEVAFATRTLGVSAGTYKMNLAAGQAASGSVTVVNSGTEPLKVMVYAADQQVDARGNVTYQTPTRADLNSATHPSSWTTIKTPTGTKTIGNIPYLELKPGDRIPVEFSVVVPQGVAPGDHNVLIFFESFEPPLPGQGSQSRVAGRLGTRVTLRVAGVLVRKLDVRPFTVPKYVFDGDIPFDFFVRNVGNLDQRIGARCIVLDGNDNEVARKTSIDGITSFAQTSLESSGDLALGKMAFGQYKVRLDVSPVDDAGNATNSGADTITVTRSVWLIPYWLVVTAIVLVVVLFIGVIWLVAARVTRGRVKRDLERAASDTAQSPPPAQ